MSQRKNTKDIYRHKDTCIHKHKNPIKIQNWKTYMQRTYKFFKMPWLILWDMDTQRFQCICFLLDIYCRTCNLLLKMVCFSSEKLEKTKFSLGSGHQLNIVSGLETGHVPTSPFSSSTPSPTDQCRLYASLWTHMWTSPVSLVPLSPLTLSLFTCLLPQSFPRTKERYFMETSLLGLNILRSFTIYISVVELYICYHQEIHCLYNLYG